MLCGNLEQMSNWILCEYLTALAKSGRQGSCQCVRSCPWLLLICRSVSGLFAHKFAKNWTDRAYLMFHIHSLPSFSGRSALDARCTAEGRLACSPTGGSWPLRAVQQQMRRQLHTGYSRSVLGRRGAQCAAAVAGLYAIHSLSPSAKSAI